MLLSIIDWIFNFGQTFLHLSCNAFHFDFSWALIVVHLALQFSKLALNLLVNWIDSFNNLLDIAWPLIVNYKAVFVNEPEQIFEFLMFASIFLLNWLISYFAATIANDAYNIQEFIHVVNFHVGQHENGVDALESKGYPNNCDH